MTNFQAVPFGVGQWSKQRIIDLSFWLWTYHLWPNVIDHSQWQKFMDRTLKKMSLTIVNDKKIVIYWKVSIQMVCWPCITSNSHPAKWRGWWNTGAIQYAANIYGRDAQTYCQGAEVLPIALLLEEPRLPGPSQSEYYYYSGLPTHPIPIHCQEDLLDSYTKTGTKAKAKWWQRQ